MNKYFFIAICKLLHFLIFVSDSDALLCSGIHVAYMYIYMYVMCTGNKQKSWRTARESTDPLPRPANTHQYRTYSGTLCELSSGGNFRCVNTLPKSVMSKCVSILSVYPFCALYNKMGCVILPIDALVLVTLRPLSSCCRRSRGHGDAVTVVFRLTME